MAITFDGPNKLIILSATTTLDAQEVYSRWKDWVTLSDNAKFEPAFSNSVGGNALGGGVNLGQYFFIQNGWQIRPQESAHTLTVTGNLFPIPDTASVYAPTLGDFNVQIIQSQSSLTQQLETGTSGLTPDESTQLAAINIVQTLVDELHKIQGLSVGNPMTVTPTSRTAGTVAQTISGDGENTSTVTRNE